MKVRQKMCVAVVALGCAAVTAPALFGGLDAGKKGETNSTEKGKTTPAAQAVQDLALAYSLIDYGRKHKSPEALITAARILGTVPTSKLKAEVTTEKSSDAGKPGKKSASTADNSPSALLGEARSMAGNNKHIVALAEQAADAIAEKSRGRVGGARLYRRNAPAYTTVIYRISFRGGRIARVLVRGDHDTDLDLYVYDKYGHLVASTTGPFDTCFVQWVPTWTGPFTVHVRNRGGVYNRYTMVTN